MTQDQANAIAEREYPLSWGPSPGGLSIDHNNRVRKAYAKALMDMNPLIEAAEAIVNPIAHATQKLKEGQCLNGRYLSDKSRDLAPYTSDLRTALLNLTKSIEP